MKIHAWTVGRMLSGAAAALALGTSPAFAVPVVFNGHSYEEITAAGPISWTNARAAAVAAGGDLVVIETAAEDAFLISAFDVFNPANPANTTILNPPIVFGPWIGLHHVPENGPGNNVAAYRWVDGTSVSYNGFFAGEPSGDAIGAGVQYLFNDFDFNPARQGWNDQRDAPDFVRSYIIERAVPEPASLVLFGLGIAALGAFAFGVPRKFPVAMAAGRREQTGAGSGA